MEKNMRHIALVAVALAALVGCDGKDKEASKASDSETAKATDVTASKDGAKEAGNSDHPKAAEAKEHSGAAGGKHPWASFKPGSFTKMKTVSEVEVGGSKHKTESTTTYTLKDVTVDEAIVETEMVVGNAAPRMHEMKLPLKAPEKHSAPDAQKAKSGVEDIAVAGKHLKCHWTESETEAGGTHTTTRVFMNEDVPGFTVKSVTHSPTMTTTTEVVEYQSK
jgi:hypothetical protein